MKNILNKKNKYSKVSVSAKVSAICDIGITIGDCSDISIGIGENFGIGAAL